MRDALFPDRSGKRAHDQCSPVPLARRTMSFQSWGRSPGFRLSSRKSWLRESARGIPSRQKMAVGHANDSMITGAYDRLQWRVRIGLTPISLAGVITGHLTTRVMQLSSAKEACFGVEIALPTWHNIPTSITICRDQAVLQGAGYF